MVFGYKKHELASDEFHWLANIIHSNIGIKYSENKKYLFESRLSSRLGKLKLNNFGEYIDTFSDSENNSLEVSYLINAVTTNETSFFRNKSQLDSLTDFIIPELIQRKKTSGDRTIKIWSAASSTGEEPYSIAMLFDYKKSIPLGFSCDIIASDINDNVLAKAKKGIFSLHTMRNLPDEYRDKYFKPVGDEFELKSSLLSKVEFKKANLIDISLLKDFRNADIIYCANVMMYFSQEAKAKAIDNMYENLLPGGYLMVGHSESLHNTSKDFTLVNANGTPLYQKKYK